MNRSKAGKLILGCFAVFGAMLFVSGFTAAAEMKEKPELKPQTTCPIMGGKINKDLYVDANGKRIYVCCQGCVAAVKKDPAGAIKKLEAKGEMAADIPAEQTTCPVMGGAINKKLYVEHNGRKLYVCCQGCLGTVKKDPEKYAKKIDAQIKKDMAEKSKK